MLPVSYPPITSLQGTASLLSVVFGTDSGKSWFYNYFVQLYGVPREGGITVSPYFAEEWRNCPVIDFQCIFIQFLMKRWGSVTQFLSDAVDSGWYVYLLLDRYYIALSDQYAKRHRPHETLVYGYNQGRKIFFVADFYTNSRFLFGESSYSEVECAFRNVDPHDMPGSIYNDLRHAVYLIRPKSDVYRFDIELLCSLIEDYFYSRDSVRAIPLVYRHIKWPNPLLRDCVVYGLCNYDLMTEYLRDVLRHSLWIDIRPFHVMCDHKTAMLYRIEYMSRNGYLSNAIRSVNEYSMIRRSAVTIRNALIKYRLTGDIELVSRTINRLSLLRNYESKAIEGLLNSIRRQ